MLSSAVQSFAGGGSAGLVAAGVAPLLPMLLEQAAGALASTDGESIDAGLAAIADLCLRARSVAPSTAVKVAPGVYVAGAHNED